MKKWFLQIIGIAAFCLLLTGCYNEHVKNNKE